MYEQVFKFNARPFTATPYVKHYFAGAAIQQSLGQAQLCIDRAAGPVIVIGDIGSGKSLLLAMLERHFASELVVVNLGCSRLETRNDLLQSILFDLGEAIHGRSEAELRFALMERAKPSPECPAGLLLLVDDAESLSRDLIEELRLITNYIVDGQPRIRLVMAGRNGLEERLADPKLASFNQRIATRCYLANLDRDETARYVIEHIDRAGGQGQSVFAPDALQRIAQVTDGCPRLINQVCEIALILGATRGQLTISSDLVSEAWADLDCLPGKIQNYDAPPAVSGDDWTVIEFGQLDDDPADASSNAPVHSPAKAKSLRAGEGANSPDPIDEQAAARSEMAAQLAAVFGSSEFGTSEPNALIEASLDDADLEMQSGHGATAEKSIDELEIEQQNLLDQVHGESSQTRRPTSEMPTMEQAPSVDLEDGLADHSQSEGRSDESSETQEPAPIQVIDEPECTPTAELDEDIPVPSASIDPFAEDFDEEEPLKDRFLPAVAQCNAKSLQITSAELEWVKPRSLDSETNAANPVVSSESMLHSDLESEEGDQGIADIGEDVMESFDPSDSISSADLIDRQVGQPIKTSRQPDVEASDIEKARIESPESNEPKTQYHQHITEASTDDITRQAEAILARLSASNHVSHETAVEGLDDEDLSPTQEQREPVEATEVDDPSEDILDEIRDQQRMLNVSAMEARQAVPEQESDSVESIRARPPVPVEFAPKVPESAMNPSHRDDSEMIIVNQMHQPEAVEPDDNDSIPFPDTPVSTGRAERMDYKQLFDQLRDMKNRTKHE